MDNAEIFPSPEGEKRNNYLFKKKKGPKQAWLI